MNPSLWLQFVITLQNVEYILDISENTKEESIRLMGLMNGSKGRTVIESNGLNYLDPPNMFHGLLNTSNLNTS